jgi:glycosyltransferase involved in cell wall biosynthesis
MESKPAILHLSCDFPDPLVRGLTPAVSNLVDSVKAFGHFVYSLNRLSWRWGAAALPFAPDRVAVAYGAPPKGFFLATALSRTAEFLIRDLERRAVGFDVVHAHKLTVEGPIAARIARHFGRPLVCSIWGNTDIRLVRARPDLRAMWRGVATDSRALFPAAPWAIDALDPLIAVDRSKVTPLPIIPSHEQMLRSAPSAPRIATVLRLEGYRNKGVLTLIACVKELRREFPELSLDIFGGDGALAFYDISRGIDRAGAAAFVHLRGPIANAEVVPILNRYAAMAMPSLQETYGLVYIEALFAGVPVVYPRGRSIDGYLPPESIGYACDPADPTDVANGLRHVLRGQASLKEAIGRLQDSGALDRFRRATITGSYVNAIERVLAAHGARQAGRAGPRP